MQIEIHNEYLKNITKIDKYKKTEPRFYEGAQNKTQLHFDEPSNKYTQIRQRSNNSQIEKNARQDNEETKNKAEL